MRVLRRVLRVWVLSLVVIPGFVWAQCTTMWDVADLARQASPVVSYAVPKGNPVRISTAWARSILEVKNRIDKASGIKTQFFLCSDAEPNAFATIVEGKNVVALTLGMGKLLGNDMDAFAAILGHENAHLTLGHHRETQTREAIIGLAQLFGSIAMESLIQSGGGGAGWGSRLTALGASLVSTAYSRENETEADRQGIRYTIAAGYDPQGAIRLHQKLDSRGGFLSTHPGSQQRVAELQRTIAEVQAERGHR